MATTSPSTAPSSTAATPNPAADKALRTGAIIGGVVGGLAVIGAVIIILYWIRRRHPKPSHATPTKENDADMEGAPSTYRQHNNEGSKNDDDTGTSAYYAHGTSALELEQPEHLPLSFRPQEVDGGVNQVHELPARRK